jgi:hypothetical protein
MVENMFSSIPGHLAASESYGYTDNKPKIENNMFFSCQELDFIDFNSKKAYPKSKKVKSSRFFEFSNFFDQKSQN